MGNKRLIVTQDQFREFERRVSLAEKMSVGISLHDIANKVTGIRIRE